MLLPPLLYVMLSVPFVSVRLPHVLAVWLTLQLQLRTASKLVSLRRMVVARYRLWDRLGDVPARRNEAVSVRRSLDAVALCHATWSVIKVLPPDIARVELAKRAAAMRAVVSLADATRVYVAHRALWSRWTSCPPSYVPYIRLLSWRAVVAVGLLCLSTAYSATSVSWRVRAAGVVCALVIAPPVSFPTDDKMKRAVDAVFTAQQLNSGAAPAAFASVGDDCPVCSEPLHDTWCVVYNNEATCGHVLCEACAQKVMSTNHLQCPVCRAAMTSFYSMKIPPSTSSLAGYGAADSMV